MIHRECEKRKKRGGDEFMIALVIFIGCLIYSATDLEPDFLKGFRWMNVLL